MSDKVGNRTMIRRVLLQVFLLLSLSGIIAACGGSSTTPKPPVPKVTITAKEFSFAMPDRIQTGLVDFTVVNAGAQEHQAQFDRLNAGVTLDQLKAAVKKGRDAALSLIVHNAGIVPIKPGQSQEIILDLSEGPYVVLDINSGADTIPNVSKGMIKSFMVTGPSNEAHVNQPKADVDVTLKDFSFVLPSTMKSGPLTWHVTNQGPQAHQMVLIKLNPGKTLNDALDFVKSQSGPPPGTVAGGLGVLEAGKTVWLAVNLAPGNYVTVCSLPDTASGKSHAELGMIAAFTVQ